MRTWRILLVSLLESKTSWNVPSMRSYLPESCGCEIRYAQVWMDAARSPGGFFGSFSPSRYFTIWSVLPWLLKTEAHSAGPMLISISRSTICRSRDDFSLRYVDSRVLMISRRPSSCAIGFC